MNDKKDVGYCILCNRNNVRISEVFDCCDTCGAEIGKRVLKPGA